ncbi:MAG: hypothetical protein ACOCWG_01705, partial [bacterium]
MKININWSNFKIYFIALISFVVVIYLYFPPLLEGEVIDAHDKITATGMAQEGMKYKEETGKLPLWTGTMFSGMPSYFIAAPDYQNLIPSVTSLTKWIVAYPVNTLLIAMISFFILMMVFKTNKWLAIAASIIYAFSTMYIILLGAGHNTKLIAISIMPLMVAGIVLGFRRKYLPAFVLLSLAVVWELYAAHYQMTYYIIIFLLIMVLIEGIYSLGFGKSGEKRIYLKAIVIFALSGILAFGVFFSRLWSEYDYSKFSTRGGLELSKDATEKTSGLDKSYILSYSYDIPEAFSAFIPRIKGGGMQENIGENSKTYEFLESRAGKKTAKQIASNAPLYWGEQPIASGPFYFGAIIVFLFVFSMFVLGKKEKWIFGSIVGISFLFSLGSHFELMSHFLLDYAPLYNKFRDVKMIVVIQHLAIAIAGTLAL